MKNTIKNIFNSKNLVCNFIAVLVLFIVLPSFSYGAVLFSDGFEDGNIFDTWVYDASTVSLSSDSAVGAASLEISGGGGHHVGVHTMLPNLTPSNVSFYVKTDRATSNSEAVAYNIIMSGAGSEAIFFYLVNNQICIYNGARRCAGSYSVNTWYLVEFRNIDFASYTFDFYVDGVLGQASVAFRNPATSFGVMYLYNFTASATSRYDEIVLSEDTGGPTASNGSLVVTEDIGGGGTLVAIDDEGDPITYGIVSDPLYGTVTLTSSLLGTYTYSPDPDFEGSDYFTFNAFDSSSTSNTATINITVNGAPDPPAPTAGSIDTYINTPKSVQVYHNDPDLGDSHSYSISTMASTGTATIDISGLATYTPFADFTGLDSFEVLVTDIDSLEGYVTVSVMVTAIDTNPPVEGSLSDTVGNAYIGLSWNGFTDDLGQLTYTLVYDTNSTPTDCSSGMLLYSGTDTSFNHIDLINGTTYYYRLCATDSAGNTTVGLITNGTPFAVLNGISTTGDDSDFDGIERSDGGDDDHNLDEATGNPITDPGFNFKIVVRDIGGSSSPIAKLYVSDRNSPTTYVSYDMMCTGDYTEGELCSYTTILGPSSTMNYYFEAITNGGSGVTLRYPSSGVITGPDVELLNSYGIVGSSRNLDLVDYDSTRGLGCTVAYRWVSDGLSRVNSGNKGRFELVDALYTLKAGESYFVNKDSCGSNTSLIELSTVNDVTSDTFEITLQQGWNLINNPYNGDVYLKDILVQSDEYPYVSWAYAVSQDWLVNSVYYYNGLDWGGTYSYVSAGGSPEGKLSPWTGYWFYQLKDDVTYKLIIPKP